MPFKISLSTMIAAIFIAGAAIALSASAATDDACSLLTQAQLKTVLSVSVGAGSYISPTDKRTCSWKGTGDAGKGAKTVTLMLQTLDAFQAGKSLQVKTIVVTPVSGIGDDAYYLAVGPNVGLIVKKGSATFKVAVYASDLTLEQKQAVEKTLALQVVSKL
jgi:hypothetical protein